MNHRKLLILILMLFASARALATVFVVTSNADSGAGTLRDALNQAAVNDSTKTDYITFNLPDLSATGRTIVLISQLPDVTSNLVIDGSTQPGATFGLSDAHVQLMYKTPITKSLSGLKAVNLHNVEIYGLYINLVTNITGSANAYSYLYSGIELKNVVNIKIGDIGKGNVINGFNIPLGVNTPDTIHHTSSSALSKNITVKANFLGIDADGETQSANACGVASIYYVVGQITIGGANPLEGNLLSSGLDIYQQNDVNSTNPRDSTVSTPAKIIIQNNKIGVDYNVATSLATTTAVMVSCVDPNGKDTVDIMDNVIDAAKGYAIFPGNIGGKIRILRNYIGIDKLMKNVVNTGGIFLYWDNLVQIGSSDPADANYITNCDPVNVWPYTNAAVNKNSFFCTKNAYPMRYIGNGSFNAPVISILNVTASTVGGTATPNAIVELFYSDKCGTCSPQTYFATTTADNSGNWQYSGAITGSVIASATLNNNTSEFTRTSIDVSNVAVINACLNNGLGSIKGAVPKSAANIKWINTSGKIVGTAADLLNVVPGKYKLLAQNGGCGDSTNYFEIKTKFELDTSKVKKSNPACGKPNGSITGLQTINNDAAALLFSWKDLNGNELSQKIDLTSAPAGSYTLTITSADKTCSQTYGPIVLKNTSGPNIDLTNAIIKPANCGQSTGSVTNVTATGIGTLTYTWLNAQQQVVSNTKDLINQSAGNYVVQLADQSNCSAVVTVTVTVPELNSINIDQSAAITIDATCGNSNGGVTGLNVTGATSYQWFDGSGSPVATSFNLANVPGGLYHMVASNSYCSKQTVIFTVRALTGSVNFPSTKKLANATCGLNNGSIQVIFNKNITLPKALRWVNAQGQNVGSTTTLNNIDAGTYQLYVTDINGCESFYLAYTIGRTQPLTLNQSAVTVADDNCGLKTGAIRGLVATNGQSPYAYSWADASGKIRANTIDLNGVSAGNYTLTLTDATGCAPVSQSFSINNQSVNVPAPSVTDLQLCAAGTALLAVNGTAQGNHYRLYADAFGTSPLDDNSTGKFNILVKANRSYFVSKYLGTCESSRAEVKVTVGLSQVEINNTITPNNDGKNDTWTIKNIENYPGATVQLYNRFGQKVFESRGYAVPFDGRINGQNLPAGTYYYIINLTDRCNLISGSLTILR